MRARTASFALWSVSLAACADSSAVSFSWSIDLGPAAGSAQWVVAEVLVGGCSGPAASRQVISRGAAGGATRISPGTIGLRAYALDAGCTRVAERCEEIMLDGSRAEPLRIVLEMLASATPECSIPECRHARCPSSGDSGTTAPDGDTAPDGSTADAGSCDSNGEPCGPTSCDPPTGCVFAERCSQTAFVMTTCTEHRCRDGVCRGETTGAPTECDTRDTEGLLCTDGDPCGRATCRGGLCVAAGCPGTEQCCEPGLCAAICP